jgi:hypothetical protein
MITDKDKDIRNYVNGYRTPDTGHRIPDTEYRIVTIKSKKMNDEQETTNVE